MGLKDRAKQAAELAAQKAREASERHKEASARQAETDAASQRALAEQAAVPTLTTAPATTAAPPGAVMQLKSHEAGRNSTVTLYPDRIERVKDRALGSMSRAKQDAEVIPTKAISSVQAKKDGLVYTKVTAYASGNNIDFRLRHDDAQRFKEALTKMILEPATPAASAPAPDLADQLTRLAALRDQGVLTEEEFAAQKAKLLG